jgi:hypothetical protein
MKYIVLTDINPSRWNPLVEKDDIQSLIRLLLYANEIEIAGIIPCTSCFLKRGAGRTHWRRHFGRYTRAGLRRISDGFWPKYVSTAFQTRI